MQIYQRIYSYTGNHHSTQPLPISNDWKRDLQHFVQAYGNEIKVSSTEWNDISEI